MNVVHEEQMR